MIGLQGRAESLAAKEAEAVALQKGEREREREETAYRHIGLSERGFKW